MIQFLTFTFLRFRLLDVWQPKSRLGGLDCFALWIILRNNWGIQKSSNNCVSSSFPLLNLQKICPHTYPHSSCANQLIFTVSGIPYTVDISPQNFLPKFVAQWTRRDERNLHRRRKRRTIIWTAHIRRAESSLRPSPRSTCALATLNPAPNFQFSHSRHGANRTHFLHTLPHAHSNPLTGSSNSLLGSPGTNSFSSRVRRLSLNGWLSHGSDTAAIYSMPIQVLAASGGSGGEDPLVLCSAFSRHSAVQ
jgi:hypothetical protein